MVTENPIVMCYSLVISYFSIYEMLEIMILGNEKIKEITTHQLNEMKIKSLLYQKVLHQVYSCDFVCSCPLLKMKCICNPGVTLMKLFQSKQNHKDYCMFVITKDNHIFFVKKINKNMMLILVQNIRNIQKKQNVHCWTISNNYHIPSSMSYIWKDGKQTKEASNILHLL